MLPINRLKFITSAYNVQRYHTSARIKNKQLIGQHSAGVALTYAVLAQCLGKNVSGQALLVALTHDMGEFYTGDMPAPAKRAMLLREAFDKAEDKARGIFGFDNTCEEADTQLIKIADAVDGMLHCLWEANGGNMAAIPVFWTFYEYASQVMEVGSPLRAQILQPLGEMANGVGQPWCYDIFDTGIGFSEVHG